MNTLLQQQQAYDAQYDRQQERDEQLEAQCDVLASSLKGDYALDVEILSEAAGDATTSFDFAKKWFEYIYCNTERKVEIGKEILNLMEKHTDVYLDIIAKREAVKELQS